MYKSQKKYGVVESTIRSMMQSYDCWKKCQKCTYRMIHVLKMIFMVSSHVDSLVKGNFYIIPLSDIQVYTSEYGFSDSFSHYLAYGFLT